LPRFKKGTDLNQYKQDLIAYKKRQLDSLNFYTRNHVASKEFINYAKADIANEYVHNLYRPVLNKKTSLQNLPSGYLQDAVLEKNEVSLKYKQALADKYLYTSPHSDFDSVYTNIIQHFSGQDRSFLLSAMIGYYALKQEPEYRTELLEAIKEAPKYVQNPEYLNYIKKAEIYYAKLNHPLPDSVLNHKYLRSFNNNKRITLKELLEHFKGKALYLDFWASWCGPCRMDISHSHRAKQYLAKKNITYIYISRDKDEQAWIKAAKQDSITQNQYLLLDVLHTPLMKYLDINYIPRYVLMNAKHDIIEPTAPRPTIFKDDTSHFDQLKKSVQKMIKETK